MKKAIYLRKSRGTIADLEKHKIQLVKMCISKGWEFDLYAEIASSEKLEERKQITKLINNIELYDSILCMHIDRLSRNELHQAIITQLLKKNNIKIITPGKIYDFNAENDILLGDFEKLLARQELRLTKMRLKRGKNLGFEKGLWVNGFPPMPYIYNKISKELEVDKDLLIKYENIKKLALNQNSISKISEKTGFNATKIRRILKSKVHLGYTKYNGEYRMGIHKAVITNEDYEKINTFIENSTFKRKTRNIYKYTGLLVCSCGKKRTVTIFNKKQGVLKCRGCKDCGFVIDYFDHYINNEIKYNKIIQNKNIFKYEKKDIFKREIESINYNITKAEKKILNIKNMMIDSIIDYDEGRVKIKNIEKYLEKLNLDKSNLLIENKKERCKKNNLEYFIENSYNEKLINEFYKEIIEKIIIKNKNIEKIVWK